MDTSTDSASRSERVRAMEPVLIFVGVLVAVAVAIALVIWEANCVPIGPMDSAAPANHGY